MGLYPVVAWAVRGNVPIKAIGEERLTAEPSPKQCREHCPSARRFGRSDLARVSAVRIPFIGRRVYGEVYPRAFASPPSSFGKQPYPEHRALRPGGRGIARARSAASASLKSQSPALTYRRAPRAEWLPVRSTALW